MTRDNANKETKMWSGLKGEKMRLNTRARRFVQLVALACTFIGCFGCGEPPPAACPVPGDTVGYQDCGKSTPDGLACVALCGVLPPGGSPGHRVPDGCEVQIGTSTPRTGLCVSDCGSCP